MALLLHQCELWSLMSDADQENIAMTLSVILIPPVIFGKSMPSDIDKPLFSSHTISMIVSIEDGS
jgi:undecaprenyl pyrophosphate phosphatase UppP